MEKRSGKNERTGKRGDPTACFPGDLSREGLPPPQVAKKFQSKRGAKSPNDLPRNSY